MLNLSYIVLVFALLSALLYEPLLSLDNNLSGNVLLLTAHPDDECMFFAPTIRALTRQTNVNLYSLCLSTGDADGLGNVRKKELARSLDVFGIHQNKRWVLDHPDLQDNFTAHWNPDIIANAIYPYIFAHNITTILTFDDRGISGHPNHCSLPAAASHPTISGTHKPPRLYTLVTLPTFAKYTGIFAPLTSKLVFYQKVLYPYLNAFTKQLGISLDLVARTDTDNEYMPPIVISGISDYLTALKAMRAHSSQLVWFRWLYVLFSRYMWVNEWLEIHIRPDYY